MFWHIETDIVCFIILGAMYFDSRKHDFNNSLQDRHFHFITKYTLLMIALDVAASLIMDFPVNRTLYHILMALYFATAPTLCFLWFYYVAIIIEQKITKKVRVLLAIALLPILAYSLVALSTPFTGLVYSLGENYEYERGPFFAFSVYLLILYTMMTAGVILIKRKQIVPRSRVWILLMFPIIVCIGTWVQLANPGMLTMNAAYTIVYVITYFYILNRHLLYDGLTGVYSRMTGEQHITDFIDAGNGKAAYIITDLDNFKRVNDKLGHLFGDNALKAAAQTMRGAFPRESVVARIGGDEFIIFVPDYGSRERLREYCDLVNERLRNAFSIDKSLVGIDHISVSMGISLFPDDGSNYLELYEYADNALLSAKLNCKGHHLFFDDIQEYKEQQED